MKQMANKITHSVREYIRKNKERDNALCRYTDGKILYCVEGLWMDEDTFNDTYPKYEFKKQTKGENPDKTRVD